MGDLIELNQNDDVFEAIDKFKKLLDDNKILNAAIVYVEAETDEAGITILTGGPPNREWVGILDEMKLLVIDYYNGDYFD